MRDSFGRDQPATKIDGSPLRGSFKGTAVDDEPVEVEILGERWTLLVLRELLVGPQRFSDLRRRLPGISPSVLAERLERLERREVIARRQVEPPTPASLYELAVACGSMPLHFMQNTKIIRPPPSTRTNLSFKMRDH